MKKQVDDLDLAILKYLEDDARKSLKKLADDMNKKTSTIYHRLQRLKSNDVILGYSIILNPEFLNIKKIAMQKVSMKPLQFSTLDGMFMKSFANFINSEFQQVLFIALSDDSKTIHMLSVHQSDADHAEFIHALKENPYIDRIDTEFLSEIIKGQKIFNFNEDWMRAAIAEPGEGGDESFEDDLELNDGDDSERMMEISLDDDDEEDLKF